MTDLTKYGFSLLRTRELDEIAATLYELEHIKTGAALVDLCYRFSHPSRG